MNREDPGLTFHPLTADRWDDLERLFGPSGAYGGCWCMWWRVTRKAFEENGNEGNRRAFRERVEAGPPPGILAYEEDVPVGWCAVAPREIHGSLERSPVLKRLDDRSVWSIVCLYVARSHRGRGMSEALIEAAVEHARAHGAQLVEAYPTRPRGERLPDVSSFMGVPEVFARTGFREAARPSEAKVVMRRELAPE